MLDSNSEVLIHELEIVSLALCAKNETVILIIAGEETERHWH